MNKNGRVNILYKSQLKNGQFRLCIKGFAPKTSYHDEDQCLKAILTCTSEWTGVLVSLSYGKEESLVRRLHSVQSCAGKVKDECPDLQTKYERL